MKTLSSSQLAANNASEYAVLVGLDWADQKHDLSVLARGTQQMERTQLPHEPAAIHQWILNLHQQFPSGKIAIALEQSRGPLIHALMAYEFVVLYPLNPQTLTNFRKAFAPANCKSDVSDADLHLTLLVLHRNQLTPWHPEDADTRLLGLLVEHRRDTVDLQTSLVCCLKSTLKAYFPLALDLVGEDLACELATALLTKWPTFQSLKGTKASTIRRFFLAHNCRSQQLMEQRLAKIASAVPLTDDRAIIRAHALRAQTLIKALCPLRTQITQYEQEIAVLFKTHPEANLFANLPGAGPALAPRLLTAFGTQRERFTDSESMPRFSGTAPVVEQSGKSKIVHMRLARPVFIHQTFVEFAKCSLNYCAWAECYFQYQRKHGMGINAALRKLALRWQRVIWRCWQDNSLYDETRYIKVLIGKCPEIYGKLAI